MADTKRLTVLIIVALWCLCSLPFAHAQEVAPVQFTEPKCSERVELAHAIPIIKKKAVSAPAGAAQTTITIGATKCGGSDPGTDCTYAGIADSQLNSTQPDTALNTSITVFVDGNEGIGITIPSLTAFRTAVGAGKTITSASIWIYVSSVDNAPGGTLTAYPILTCPGDQSSTAVNLGNCTYNERDTDDDYQWGGDTQARPLADTDYDSTTLLFTFTTADVTGDTWKECTSANLTSLVQDWYDETTPEYGVMWFLSDDYSRVSFRSDDYSTTYLRWYLEITYQ